VADSADSVEAAWEADLVKVAAAVDSVEAGLVAVQAAAD
jgi:hypothetical protein